MTEAICTELLLRKDYLGQKHINTIYFGGGTPSIIPSAHLQKILDTIQREFIVADKAEITLEANPEDLTAEKLRELKALGINRLSIGIQTFDEDILKYLNRSHNASTSIRSIELARKEGFHNISIDLIYAIPGLSDEKWKANIDLAVSMEPEHISSYSLTVEPKTVFGNWLKKGKLEVIDDDIAARQLIILSDILASAGYDQYEVSNFGKPGFYSRHNSNYWKQEKYLGVGPGAHSYDRDSRQFNARNNHLYIRSIQKSTIPSEKEVLTTNDKVNDYLLTTLRTQWGADLNFISKNLGVNLFDKSAGYIQTLMENQLASLENGVLTLTKKGMLVADKISSDLFLNGD